MNRRQSVAASIGLIGVVAMIPACTSNGWHRNQSVPDPTPEQQVAATLDAFHDAAARADEALYFGLLADDAVFLGTDPAERWPKPDFQAWAEPYFGRDSAWTYHAIERHITLSPRGDVAWFDEVVRNDTYGDLRGTGVLLRDPSSPRGSVSRAWKIAQYNLTFMVPNDVAPRYLELVQSPGTPR